MYNPFELLNLSQLFASLLSGTTNGALKKVAPSASLYSIVTNFSEAIGAHEIFTFEI